MDGQIITTAINYSILSLEKAPIPIISGKTLSIENFKNESWIEDKDEARIFREAIRQNREKLDKNYRIGILPKKIADLCTGGFLTPNTDAFRSSKNFLENPRFGPAIFHNLRQGVN